MTEIARITPALRVVAHPTAHLTGTQKAAIIVRLLLAEGAAVDIRKLPDHMQAALAEQMGQLRLIDRTTLTAVVEEFVTELEQVGLSFPEGIEGALGMMDGHISPSAANRLRRLASAGARADPWDRIVPLPPERLLPLLEEESPEVAAVILSKLPVTRAADLLSRLPGDRARRVAYAVSLTGNIDPETVRRIGVALAAQLGSQPPSAFEAGPVERVGAILNVSPAATRESVLQGLEETDTAFAEQVRRAIFTFGSIPARLAPRDVARVLRGVDPAVLVTALAYAAAGPLAPVVEFLLSNMSPRLAQSLRESMAERGTVREKQGEEATAAVVGVIRQLEAAGEIVLIQPDE
ncbi:MAG: flagellar motor switch protein FliG [Rhodobacterales bacterium]|nr:flagellar motor switch protein FliG [Rhodobacterales bacterium]